MPTMFRPYEPDQLLLSPNMRDWLPEEHLAHHVSHLVDGQDLMAFHAPYEADGRCNAPYRASDDGEGSAIRVCDRGAPVAWDC